MLHTYSEGLVLNKTETTYLDRLLKHNWLYPLCDSNREYFRAKQTEVRLSAIAREKRGNYLVLFERVERVKRQYKKLREVRHTFIMC